MEGAMKRAGIAETVKAAVMRDTSTEHLYISFELSS
jgi:hypothetical protein